MILGLSGCQSSSQASDILTQKPIQKDKIPITVLVKYAFTINNFEEKIEEIFPDIDIIQVGNYTRNMGTQEYLSRMVNDDLTDIVMTWPLDVGKEYWSERLIDLSSMEFTERYTLSMLNNVSQNGKLYYLPGPSQIRGIVYNKTLFNENGWVVPNNFEEFVSLCQTIEKSGIRSLQLSLGNPEVLDTAFVGYNFANYFSKPQDIQWLDEYNNNNKGSFGDHFSPALDVFQQMIDFGIFKEDDLDVYYQDREKMLFTRQCAMVEDSVLVTRMGFDQIGTEDEFAIMPFFNPSEYSEWARLYMVCYIGLNKHLQEPQNKEKYEAVLELMDYISTPEGQLLLASDTGAMFSSLIDAPPPNVDEMVELVPALNAGQYGVFPQFKNSQKALRNGLSGMLKGDLTKEDVIKMVDEENSHTAVIEAPLKLGTATKDFTVLDTGNFVTDAMKERGNTDIALFLDNGKDGKYNGKGISASLYEGDVSEADLDRILPDLKHGEDGVLWNIEMTGENLIKTIEYAIPVDNNITGWFYYFSGLKITFDPTANQGKRIKKITTSDGQKIDPDKIYSIAVMDYTVPEEFMISCEKTEITINDILVEYISNAKEISPSNDKRFVLP